MTEQQCHQKLSEWKDASGLDSLIEAADDVLLHYNMFDYRGADKPFIDYCEKVIESEQKG